MSPHDANPTVVDTVILRYFYFVDQADLLFALLGQPLLLPRVVYDPDEETGLPELMSEITRSIHVQRARSEDRRRDKEEREVAVRNLAQLESVRKDHASGRIEIADLTHAETELFAKLASRGDPLDVGLRFGLDPGEAACVAIAVERRFVLATDDNDALKAYRALRPKGRYERIRKLLKRAATTDLISEAKANEIHQAMRDAGFWDSRPPF